MMTSDIALRVMTDDHSFRVIVACATESAREVLARQHLDAPDASHAVIAKTLAELVTGVVLVRALPNELRNVEKYLRATQLVAERQVMLEAKIIDVTLSEDFQSGVNWGAFKSGPNSRSGIGVAQPGATLGVGAATQTIGQAT